MGGGGEDEFQGRQEECRGSRSCSAPQHLPQPRPPPQQRRRSLPGSSGLTSAGLRRNRRLNRRSTAPIARFQTHRDSVDHERAGRCPHDGPRRSLGGGFPRLWDTPSITRAAASLFSADQKKHGDQHNKKLPRIGGEPFSRTHTREQRPVEYVHTVWLITDRPRWALGELTRVS